MKKLYLSLILTTLSAASFASNMDSSMDGPSISAAQQKHQAVHMVTMEGLALKNLSSIKEISLAQLQNLANGRDFDFKIPGIIVSHAGGLAGLKKQLPKDSILRSWTNSGMAKAVGEPDLRPGELRNDFDLHQTFEYSIATRPGFKYKLDLVLSLHHISKQMHEEQVSRSMVGFLNIMANQVQGALIEKLQAEHMEADRFLLIMNIIKNRKEELTQLAHEGKFQEFNNEFTRLMVNFEDAMKNTYNKPVAADESSKDETSEEDHGAVTDVPLAPPAPKVQAISAPKDLLSQIRGGLSLKSVDQEVVKAERQRIKEEGNDLLSAFKNSNLVKGLQKANDSSEESEESDWDDA